MQYQLVQNYFQTPLFRDTVQDYFDTVLTALVAEHALTETKGKFIRDNVLRADLHDMPYHTHILNGLIPMLWIYEQFLLRKNQLGHPETSDMLRILILGFTFHDANKLMRLKEEKGKTDLEISIERLRAQLGQFREDDFFPKIKEKAWLDVLSFLALATENRTRAVANLYPLGDLDEFIREYLGPLCHFADGLASLKETDSPGAAWASISAKIERLPPQFGQIPISYIEVHPNPFVLLSQSLMQAARTVLGRAGKKPFFSMRQGFLYFGESATEGEVTQIVEKFRSERDLKIENLSTIDYQSCEFGFIGSKKFVPQDLDHIIFKEATQNAFLKISPSSRSKIADFDEVVQFCQDFLRLYPLAANAITVKLDKKKEVLSLSFNPQNDQERLFQQFFALHKIQWLNVKSNGDWSADFGRSLAKNLPTEAARADPKQNRPLPAEILAGRSRIRTMYDATTYLLSKNSAATPLLKTLICAAKTATLFETPGFEPEAKLAELKTEVIDFYQKQAPSNWENTLDGFAERYLFCQSDAAQAMNFFEKYDPRVPRKEEMCLFTGALGTIRNSQAIAFGVGAAGFSNRTVTALKNKYSYLSPWFAEENKLRVSYFPEMQEKANTTVYYDFGEVSLDIGRDVLTAAVKAKPGMLAFEKDSDGVITLNKDARFRYDFFHLYYDETPADTEALFKFVRKCLMLVREFGLRAYVTGLMSPYAPHKAIFQYENAPAVLARMGWDSIRLVDFQSVWEEIELIPLFGKDRVASTLLKVSESRRAYFRLFYTQTDRLKNKEPLRCAIVQFVDHQPQLFQDMHVNQELVARALRIEVASYKSSSSNETWLLRSALEKLRTYVRQEKERDAVVSKIAAEIYRRMKTDWIQRGTAEPEDENTPYEKTVWAKFDSAEGLAVIEDFAGAVYDLLYVQKWNKTLPSLNVQKDWIYEFAFLFKKASIAENDRRKAAKAKTGK